MKVTFVYTDYGQFNQNNFNRGVAILSSCLKKEGFSVSLIHISKCISKKEFRKLIKQHNPGLVAFSCLSHMFSQIKSFSCWVKELGLPALHGGMHPTVAPEECLAEEGITAVCRGEGEGAIVDFCRAEEAGRELRNIPNIWAREDSRVFKNSCRGLIENLDSLPYPDYEIFEYEKLEEGRVHKILVTQASRGCIYDCTYCCNPLLRSLYTDKKKFLRHYSVSRLLDEIEWGLKLYPFLKEVRFYDDTLTQDKNWFSEFAVKYKSRIGLPYSGNERVENIDIETALALKESGCVSLDLGIESGDSFIREEYMHRRMSDEKIVEAFSILRKCGIGVNSFNILGMVGETPDSAIKTIKLNARVSPAIVFNAYFYPFKGSQSYDMVKERKYPVRYGVSSFFERPVVRLDTIKEEHLTFFYKYFYFLMGIYRFLWKRFGHQSRPEKALDKMITSAYLPYRAFNFFHFGKEDILSFLRKHPGPYVALRKAYRSLKGKR